MGAMAALVCAAAAAGVLVAEGPRASAQEPAPDTAALRQAMEEVMEREGIPGAGVALVSADSLLWEEGLGVADRDGAVPVDAGTAFGAGAAGGTVVALLVLRLSEEDALALDDPVGEHVPDVSIRNPWGDTNPLLIVHLMEHTGGLSELSLGTLARDGAVGELGRVLAEDPLVRDLRWPPGRQMARSRAGPALAARAVEHLAGESFEAVAWDAVLEPLGMEGAAYRVEAVEGRLAQGYAPGGRRPVEHRVAVPEVEGLLATPRELARVPQLLLGRGTVGEMALLGPGAVEWMEEPATGLAARAGLGVGYGFGVDASVEEGFVFLGHDGEVDGFSASWGYVPDAGVGYAVMANSGGDGFRELRAEVRRHLVADHDPPPPESRAVVPQRGLRELEGRYERVSSAREALVPLHRLVGMVRVRVSGDPDADLEVRGAGEASGAWVATAGRRFRPAGEPVSRLAFETDEAGRRLLVATGEGLEGSYAPVPAWSFWTRWVMTVLVLAGVLSSLAFAVYWVPEWVRGRFPEGERVSVRALPAMASLSLVLGLLIPWVAGGQAAARLGVPSIWSVGFMALTGAFAVLSVAGTVQAIRARDHWCPSGVRTHARAVSVANLLALLYLAAFGLVAARPWLL